MHRILDKVQTQRHIDVTHVASSAMSSYGARQHYSMQMSRWLYPDRWHKNKTLAYEVGHV